MEQSSNQGISGTVLNKKEVFHGQLGFSIHLSTLITSTQSQHAQGGTSSRVKPELFLVLTDCLLFM